ncbi:glycosyltransferase family 2 protein [Desulfovibrio caledoniensis]
MADPRLTVLMPVYNGERFLQQALDSILAQTCGDFRLFVCNDGSTDGTAEILARCGDSRLRVFEQENRGVVESLNRMLEAAGTELVARHDADDVSHPERFARQITHLDAHPEVGLLGTYACKISEAGDEVGCITPHVAHEDIVRCLPDYNQFVHGSVMMRRAACERAGGYASVFVHGEDYELWFRMTRVTRAGNLPEKLYRYRLHGSQIQALRTVEQQRIRDFVGRFSMGNAYDALMDGGRGAGPRSLYLVDDRSALPEHGVGLAVEDAEAIGLHLDRALELYEPDEVVLSPRHDARCLDLVKDRTAARSKHPVIRVQTAGQAG